MENIEKKPTRTSDRGIPGMEIQSIDPPNPWPLVVISQMRREDWRVHGKDPAAPHTASGADTTLVYWDKEYRIAREKQTPDGWVYCMEPWPDHATVFHRLELSYEALKREEEHRKELDRMLLKNKLAPLYDFMVGFLPASMQEQLSDRWDFDPVSASRKNARVTQYIGFFMTAGNMVFSPPLAIAGICIFFDGFIRRAYTIAHDQPCGLLVFEMVDRLFFKQIEKFFHREDRPRPLDERDWED